MKMSFSTEVFGKSHSRHIFTYRMKMLKIFMSLYKHSSTHPRKNDGRTTRGSRDMQTKVKILDFQGIQLSEYSDENVGKIAYFN